MPAMFMLVMLHGLAVYGCFSCAAAANVTHLFSPIPRRVP
jgi:hypothetical protein